MVHKGPFVRPRRAFELEGPKDWYVELMRELCRTGGNRLPTWKAFPGVQPGSLALLALNVIGSCVYVLLASPSWAIAEERGLHSTTGEPFVWFAGVLPVVAVFFVLNSAWGALILVRRHWLSGRVWLLAVVFWLVAVSVDFAHH
jgi:hypothetical protein